MATEIRTILKLQVPVIVQIGKRSLPVDDVLALGPGAILELGRSSESELELLVNNKAIATGQAVKVGENFGLKVTSIGTQRQRVQALGE
ncbi:MAG: FliM/FliN family flagellar motor C-terminal domain-containing protein [Phycisphaeraceae bacterium]